MAAAVLEAAAHAQGVPVHILTGQSRDRSRIWRQVYQAVETGAVQDYVIQRGLDDRGVVTQVPDGDVAARTQNPPKASSAALFAGIATPVVVIDVPALPARIGCAADGALAVLRSEHRVELLRRQTVPAQVNGPGVLRVLLPVDLPALALVFGMARTAVRRGWTAEIATGFLLVTLCAGSPGELGITGLRPLRCRLLRMLGGTEAGSRAGSTCLVFKRVVSELACPDLDRHDSVIHARWNGWMHESYSRSASGRAVPASPSRRGGADMTADTTGQARRQMIASRRPGRRRRPEVGHRGADAQLRGAGLRGPVRGGVAALGRPAGTLEFTHAPRRYFSWKEDRP
jgi:hypothetical protein